MNTMTARRTTNYSGATRAIVAALLALFAATALSLIGARPASASTLRYWTGAGADAKWTNPANWEGGAPVAGDQLVFGEGAARLSNVNNFPVDTSFDSIIFHGTGYNLTGNRVRLTDGLFTYHDVPATMTDTVTLAIRVPELLYFKASDDNHTVTYKGGFVLDADATFHGRGRQVVTGPVTGAGAIVGLEGRLTLAGTSTTTGPTRVTGATVAVTGTYASRPVTISAGSLEGSGTVGAVTATAGYIVPKTQSATPRAAVLTVNGILTTNTVSQYQVVVNGPAAGQYGQLVVSGKVRLTDTPLVVDSANRTSAVAVGKVLTIVKNNNAAAVSGIFDDAPEGSTVQDRHDGRITYRISYKGGAAGRDVTLTVLTTV